MGDYASAHAIGTLFTAHTRDDQAETLLMRLARGSGLDGLAGIAPSVDVATGSSGSLRVARPLLDMAKVRLVATLEERGIVWSEDPSNVSPAFERSRLRAARPELDGLGLSSDKLALSVRRLQRARTALDAVTDTYCAEGEGIVHTDRCGFFRIDRERLGRAPEEILLRVIGRCIAAAGGSAEPVSLAKLEPIVTALRDRGGQEPAGWTLARGHVTVDGPTIQIEREPGRQPLPVLTVSGGTSALWDGRFAIDIAEGFEGNLDVRALGAAGLVELERAGVVCKRTRPLRLVPSFWRGEALLAAPTLGSWARTELAEVISANFVGLRYNSRATGRAANGA
jgi:tRNA(Ile)-lysidine synthase